MIDKKERLEDEWDTPQRKISEVKCPQCKHRFILRWNDYSFGGKPQTLFERSCPSGGVYDMRIECPNCDYVEEL